MHECNGCGKFVQMSWAHCLSSQITAFNMSSTHRQCGADEGQMRKLIGHLVAAGGDVGAVAAKFVPSSPQSECGAQALRDSALIYSISADLAANASSDASVDAPGMIVRARAVAGSMLPRCGVLG